jgi:predicted RNA binding protein YcfA (HicA-like mRNA interferase family)
MTYGELIRRLRRLGVEFHHQGGGSHEFWWNPVTKGKTQIAAHRGREIPSGTLQKILSDLDLTLDDLRNA